MDDQETPFKTSTGNNNPNTPSASTAQIDEISPLEQEILDEYSKLVTNLDDVRNPQNRTLTSSYTPYQTPFNLLKLPLLKPTLLPAYGSTHSSHPAPPPSTSTHSPILLSPPLPKFKPPPHPPNTIPSTSSQKF